MPTSKQKDQGQRAYSIGELAETYDITARTIRFYEDQGLLAPQRVGSIRIYGVRDKARLQLILRGKRLGFSLAEVREWLDLYDQQGGHARQLKALLERVRPRIAALEQRKADLEVTLAELRAVEAETREALAAKGMPSD